MRRRTSKFKMVVGVIVALILLPVAFNSFKDCTASGNWGTSGSNVASSSASYGASSAASLGASQSTAQGSKQAGSNVGSATSLSTANSASATMSGSGSSVTGSAALASAGLAVVQAEGFNVYDGDTFHAWVGGADVKVRVIGVDTPEISPPETGAIAAKEFCASRVDGKTIWLVYETAGQYDKYGRQLAYVWLSEPPDTLEAAQKQIATNTLNGLLLSGGYATIMNIAPNTTFASELAAAKAAGTKSGQSGQSGQSAGSKIVAPTTSDASANASSHGSIKGNISTSTGEKIYHMPGQRYYDQTVIDESKGERWFNTEEEARAAGWRKSKV